MAEQLALEALDRERRVAWARFYEVQQDLENTKFWHGISIADMQLQEWWFHAVLHCLRSSEWRAAQVIAEEAIANRTFTSDFGAIKADPLLYALRTIDKLEGRASP